MTSIKSSLHHPKRAEELEKEWEELHEGFKIFRGRWEEFHQEEMPGDCDEKKKFKEKQSFLLRLLRAISWLKRAQQMKRDMEGADKDLHT